MGIKTLSLRNPVTKGSPHRGDLDQLELLPAIADRLQSGAIKDVEKFLHSKDYLVVGTDTVQSQQTSFRRIFGLLFGKAVPSDTVHGCAVEEVYLAADVKAEEAFPPLFKGLLKTYQLDMARIFVEPVIDAPLLASLRTDGFHISDERNKGGVVYAELWAPNKKKR